VARPLPPQVAPSQLERKPFTSDVVVVGWWAWHASGEIPPPMPTQRPPSPFNRPRWTEREARAALAVLERSRKPVSVFAAEHGLDAQRL